MQIIVLPHALKHGLTEREIVYAWESAIKCRQRQSKDEPPRWIAIGFLPNGAFAELVAIQDINAYWNIFHAMTPPTKKFLKELEIRGG
jgi:hypothetical protein